MVSGNANSWILDELTVLLAGTSLKTSRKRDALVVRNEDFLTRVEIVAPEIDDSPIGPIKCVVQISSDLPEDMARIIIEDRKLAALMNRMASLGALTFDGDRVFVGSRLTIFESYDAWNIQAPLILEAIISARDSMLSATGKVLAGDKSEIQECAWQNKDFKQIEIILSDQCVCTSGELGFTAEFGLRPEEVSATAGNNGTALWRIEGDVPHPALGGGLFSMLQLPHRVADRSHLAEALRQLNQLEMQAHPLPPHFGAWCVGKIGGNPAYVSFLTNALHDAAPGIAVNVTTWASARAQWANITLASMGITLP